MKEWVLDYWKSEDASRSPLEKQVVAADDKDKQDFHIKLSRKRLTTLEVKNILNTNKIIIQEWEV